MTTDGFTMETEFSYGLLAGPQSVLEPAFFGVGAKRDGARRRRLRLV
jgi:hypothetical protein